MNRSFWMALLCIALLGIFAGGCTATAAPVEPTVAPSATFSPIPPTETSFPTFTSTATTPPTPTPLPGIEVFSLDTLRSNIPWLPFDENTAAVVQSVFFNTQIPPFDNVLVRQAFAASIDRQVIVEMAERYQANNLSVATTFIPPAILGRDLTGVIGINFDPERAKELFEMAGYGDASTFPKVRLIVNYYGDISPGLRFLMAKEMAEMWKTYLGVTVNVETMQPNNFKNTLKTNPPEMFWNGYIDSDPGMINIFSSDSEMNYGRFSHSGADALIERAGGLHDPAERQALYIQIERIVCEEAAAVIPLFHVSSGSK